MKTVWKGLPDFNNLGEPVVKFRRQFPTFHLEDKVVVDKGGSDTTPQCIYTRKKEVKDMRCLTIKYSSYGGAS